MCVSGVRMLYMACGVYMMFVKCVCGVYARGGVCNVVCVVCACDVCTRCMYVV